MYVVKIQVVTKCEMYTKLTGGLYNTIQIIQYNFQANFCEVMLLEDVSEGTKQ